MDRKGNAVLAIAAAVTMVALVPAGRAEWKGYFDVTSVGLPTLARPDWEMRVDGQSVRFLCVAAERCPSPTAIEIKGVLRTESLPAAFVRGPLSPEELARQGEVNAKAKGSRFLGAIGVKIGGIEGVQMTAAVGADGKAIHFLTTWLGRGDRMLDIKITSPDLVLARKLAADILEPAVRQVFK